MLTRYPYLLEYRPRTTFHKLNYLKIYSTEKQPTKYYFSANEIHTDIVRKQCMIKTPQKMIDMYNLYTKLYKRRIPAEWKDMYSKNVERTITKEIDEYCNSLFEESFEMWFYYALCFPHKVKQPYTFRKFNMEHPNLFPRVYKYELLTRQPYVDMEALIDLILYTPGLYQHYHTGIINQSRHFYIYHENTYIPFSEAIQDGFVRPNVYWNKDHDIGWRQEWNAKKNKFETKFLTNNTYTQFMKDMRETIYWLHKHRIVYLDWNVRNIGYSELDRKFKLFDFDAITLVKREQFVTKPLCNTYKVYLQNTKKYPENYTMSSRHLPMSAYEIDWNLFYDMLREVV